MLTPFVLVSTACAGPPSTEADFAAARDRLVDAISSRDISRPVLDAMRKVPRHRFMPRETWHAAYVDQPVAIGHDQTISQPTVVGMMSTLADVGAGEKVLEVGTGSGYQAAVLAALGADVYTIEIVPALARSARAHLEQTGFAAVHCRTGDGYAGWPEAAPFDAIVVTAAPEAVPPPLLEQLAVGGVLVIPVGPVDAVQELVTVTRTASGVKRRSHIPVRFVPMTGEAQKKP